MGKSLKILLIMASSPNYLNLATSQHIVSGKEAVEEVWIDLDKFGILTTNMYLLDWVKTQGKTLVGALKSLGAVEFVLNFLV